MEPLAPRTTSGRRRSRQEGAISAVMEHRAPTADTEARIAAAIAQRSSLQGGSAELHHNDTAIDELKPERCYEYLDHTADIQLHAWGDSFTEALEHVLAAMFGYMTDLESIAAVEAVEPFVVKGHDRTSFVFALLQEWLGQFHETGFVPSIVTIDDVVVESYEDDGGEHHFTARTYGKGERFDGSRHASGTEVKAITFSNLQVVQTEPNGRWDIWVIVDI